MAAICTGDFTGGNGQYLGKSSLTGGPNLRASHTFCVRVKHTTTSTTIDSLCAAYVNNAGTTGSGIGRNSGVTSTGLRAYRISTIGTADAANYSTAYGNTTTWYHVTFVYNATTQFIRVYYDGVFIGQHSSVTTRPSSSTTNLFYIGWSPGKYADAGIWDRALSDSEVADQAAYRECQVTSGLLGFWRLDSNGNDSSGNGQNFTAQGSGTAVSYSTADNPPQPESPVVDVVGTATSASTLSAALNTTKPVASTATSASTLTGALNTTKPIAATATSADTLTGALRQTHAMVGSATSASSLAAWIRPRWGRRINSSPGLTRASLNLSTSAFTFMTWIKHVNVGTGLARAYITNASTVELLVSGTNIVLRVNDGASNVINNSSASGGTWHHLAVTYDGVTARAYLDGSQVASAACTLAGSVFNNIQIDNSAGSGIGEFAHVKIWTTALPAAEVLSEANFYTPHSATSQLFAWWPLAWQSPGADASGVTGPLTVGTGDDEAQSESPGAELTNLASTATSASTLTGALVQQQALAATATSASTLTGAAIQSQALAATATSASTLAGALNTVKPIASTATSASTLSADLTQQQALAGTTTSASTLTADLVQTFAIASTATSASTLSGALNAGKPLAAQADSASTLTGAMVQTQALVATADSASTLSGLLTVPGAFVGVSTSASTLTGDLTQSVGLAAAATSASTLSGALTA